MAYQSISGATPQPDRDDSRELETRSAVDDTEGPPSTTQFLEEDLEHAKPFIRSTSPSTSATRTGWPVEPQRVARFTPWRTCVAAFDVVLASTPIMFIALALIASRLDGKEVSVYGRRVEETLLLSPTIFPLIFAALMGRFFRHLGAYLAERGTTLGRLEQLVGCQSVFTALERQLVLRCLSVVGLLSVLVWLLSPVGGQSALRLLGQETRHVSSTRSFRYMDPNSEKNTSLMGGNNIGFSRGAFTSIFLAALLSSSRYQDTPMDLWGNIKVPLLGSIRDESPDEWKQIRVQDVSRTTYGSLIGVPVVGISEGYSIFNIRTRQFEISCSSNEMLFYDKAPAIWVNSNSSWKYIYNKDEPCLNFPCPVVYMSLVWERGDMRNVSVAMCNVDYNYFEAKVNCNETSCGVSAMRKLDLLSDGYTQGDVAFTRRQVIPNLIDTMPSVDNYKQGTLKASSISERWIVNNTDFIGSRTSFVELYKQDLEVLSQRLTILWNTFYQSTFATTAIGGALPADLVQTGLLTNGDITFNSTQADMVQETPAVYTTNWKWFVALLVSSLVLLVAAYVGLILKYISLAPDIIGFASSLTILNPYVPTPMGGTTLHGLERAALLYDLPVRIGDVCADESIGAIAFAKADEGQVVRLDRRRLYV